MAHHKSALKRIRQNEKRRIYNRRNKKLIKTAIRSVREADNYETALENFRKAGSVLDKAAVRGIIHKNKAAGQKSKLSKVVLSLKGKQEPA